MQDYIFTAGAVVLFLALIPSVRSENKPAASSSVLTGSVLLVFALTYLSLSFWFSAATTAITAGLWFTLAVQKMSERNDTIPSHNL